MAVTKLEQVDVAGNDLGILRLGQSLQTADQTRVAKYYDEVYADLKKEGLATWTATGSLPDELSSHVSALMCEKAQATYSLSNDRFQRLALRWNQAKREIRKLITPPYESTTEARDF